MAEGDVRSKGEALIPTEEFQARFREEAERLSGFVPKFRGEQFCPMLVALFAEHGAEGKRKGALVAVPMPEGAAKHEMMFGLGAKMAREGHRVVAALLVAEAWTKFLSPAEGWRAKTAGMQRPSEAPDRRESLVLWGRTLDGRTALGVAPLERKGNAVLLGKWEFAGEGEVEDNLLGHFFAGHMRVFAEGDKEPGT
jgi:hypothetical protein